MTSDTIAAISTATGEAAIGVLRLSGPDALGVAEKIFRARKSLRDLKPRTAHLGEIVDAGGAVIDHALLTFFRTPASYTGEDVVELHCHGGILVTQKILETLLQHGARQAEPGEFTQRAFLNGKMDLTQAEAVMDLIHAHSTLAMRAANDQLGGVIGREATAMRAELIQVLAHIEAYIDFPDEDIAPETGAAMLARLGALIARADKLLATSEHGRILRQGARTVICGEPNVGKSSLLNLLLGFERAIVSATAGTTRDTIEEFIQVHGIPLRLVDTAGLRESGDEVERHGIQRASHELERADLVIEVIDASKDRAAARRAGLSATKAELRVLVMNKTDLGIHPSWSEEKGIRVSCTMGAGLDELRATIRDVVMRAGTMACDHIVAINARHQSCFERARRRLLDAQAALRDGKAPEFVALDAREALQALGEVIGQVDVEEILGAIFAQFCIGK